MFEGLAYTLRVCLGTTKIFGGEINRLKEGNVVKFRPETSTEFDLVLGDRCIAKGKIVDTDDGNKGIRISKMWV